MRFIVGGGGTDPLASLLGLPGVDGWGHFTPPESPQVSGSAPPPSLGEAAAGRGKEGTGRSLGVEKGDPASCPDAAAPPAPSCLLLISTRRRDGSRASDGGSARWLGCSDSPRPSPFSCSLRNARPPPDQRGGRASRPQQPSAPGGGARPPTPRTPALGRDAPGPARASACRGKGG